jgi:kojibiose phosphorylase
MMTEEKSNLPLPQKSDIQGAIFDLDGVLTDTAEFHYQSWQQLADEEGLPFNRKVNEALRGLCRRDSLMIVLGERKYSEEKIQELMERKNFYFMKLIEKLGPENLLPGVKDLLDELQAVGIKIAIASSSRNVKIVVERLGIVNQIETITDAYSVDRTKPAPDIFLHTASKLQLKPAQCIVFEDASSGVEAALAGGMWAVGIGPKERVGDAHIIVASLEDVCWTDLVNKLSCL